MTPRAADRARVVEGLVTSRAGHRAEAAALGDAKRLTPRWFVIRDVHDERGARFLQPRWAMSYLKGPMTRGELKRALRDAERWEARPDVAT